MEISRVEGTAAAGASTTPPPAGSGPGPGPGPAGIDEPWSGGPVRTVVRVAIGVMFLLVVAVLVTNRLNPGPPADSSAAAGFARDMIEHHTRAVEMATVVGRRSRDPQVRELAAGIVQVRSAQIRQMQDWLVGWGLAAGRTGEPMQWMDGLGHTAHAGVSGASHLDENGLMPGTPTAQEAAGLRSLDPDRADLLFLQLMVANDRSGAEMAEAVLDLTDLDVVRTFARGLLADQPATTSRTAALLADHTATPTDGP